MVGTEKIDDLVEETVQNEKRSLTVWSFFMPLILGFFIGISGGLLGIPLIYIWGLNVLFQFIGFIDSFFKKPQKNKDYKYLRPSEKELFLRLFRKEVRGGCVSAYISGFIFWNIASMLLRNNLNIG
jgi:hypothetical protein